MNPSSSVLSIEQIPVGAIRQAIRDVVDYPKPGIVFKDITTVISDAHLFKSVLDYMTLTARAYQPDYIVGIEARGFIFGAPLADRLGVGFVPVRKKGKLPGPTVAYSYELEYGTDTIELHEGAIAPGKRVLIVDDLLATGGTAAACAHLLSAVGASVVAMMFMIELDFLKGRQQLPPHMSVESMIHYSAE
jgi:adenine phosphoribosyltransferase